MLLLLNHFLYFSALFSATHLQRMWKSFLTVFGSSASHEDVPHMHGSQSPVSGSASASQGTHLSKFKSKLLRHKKPKGAKLQMFGVSRVCIQYSWSLLYPTTSSIPFFVKLHCTLLDTVPRHKTVTAMTMYLYQTAVSQRPLKRSETEQRAGHAV